MATKKKNKTKYIPKNNKKKKKKSTPKQKNRIITSMGINVPIEKEKLTLSTIKKKSKTFLNNLINKENLKERFNTIKTNTKPILHSAYDKIKAFILLIFKILKELYIFIKTKVKVLVTKVIPNTWGKLKIFTASFSKKFKIKALKVCKVLLIYVNIIKKSIINKYNSIKKQKQKHVKVSQVKKTKKIRKTEPTLKENRYKEIYLNDDPQKLHYKDYPGFAKITVFFINRIRVMKFDMKKFNKKFKYGTLKDKILILMMLCLISGFSLIIAFCIYIVVTAPEISNQRLYKASASVFLDVNGNEFARRGTENREKVTYDDLPEVLVDAIVSAEDSRFFQHNGVDIARFSKAVIGQLLGRNDAGGGSTITMQVSKNAATSSAASGFAGIKRKFTDIYLSVFVFEKNYTKDQIMEFYVNIPYLGSGTYGVQQAAKTFFDKEAKDLTLVEAATIAGLFQSPDAYDPNKHPAAAENRRNTILNLMCRHGYITEEERDYAKSVPLTSTLAKFSAEANKYQDFIDTVTAEIEERTGCNSNKATCYTPVRNSMIIHTTMDPEKQQVVNKVMTGESYNGKEGYKWPNDRVQTGISVVSVKDGSLVAVGASRDTKQLAYNYATTPRRHPGSVAKPVVDYGPAIEYKHWGTGQTIVDDRMSYTGGGQIKNWDNGYKGLMTAKTALAQSRNIPALYTFLQTSNEEKLTFVNNLGWHPEDATGYINEAASIGGFEGVSSLQAAAAYATFARGGTYIEPYSYTSFELVDTGEVIETKPKKVQAMSDATAYIINMILKYAVTSGSVGAGSVSGTDLCAKTGTSTIDSAAKKSAGIKGSIIGDSWTVAYSPDFAIATWYGYSPQIDQQPDKLYYLTNGEGGTARKAITKYLTKYILPKNSKFEKPSSVVQVEVELGTDPIELASPYTPQSLRSTEYYKKGYAPTQVSERFNKLAAPKDLKYSTNQSQTTLTWSAAPTPREANHEKLREYFSNNVYSRWTDKYLQERIAYNNSTFGSFGYQVYIVTPAGVTTDLGYTTNTTFTINTPIPEGSSIVVKSSYQYFKSNQSDGISVKVSGSGGTTEPTTPPSNNQAQFKIEFNHNCVTADTYNALGKDKVRIISNNQNVTDKATISAECQYNGSTIDCNRLENGKAYTVHYKVTYGGTTLYKTIQIKESC